MIEVSNVSLPLDAGLPDGARLERRAIARSLSCKPSDIASFELSRRSVDARKKNDVHFIATFVVSLIDPDLERRLIAGDNGRSRGARVRIHKPYERMRIPCFSQTVGMLGGDASPLRPVVVGFGPAGMFAALYLAEAGLRPLVVERGSSIERRRAAVDAFEAGGPLDVGTNIQFGEGGAGTFSDGKLTTGTKSPIARHILRWLIDAGAPEEIWWQAKPHVGTDKLETVVRRLRERIVSLGAEVRFDARLSDWLIEGGRLRSVEIEDAATGATETVAADQLILACGHSARDTFRLARDAGARMERKAFSIGVRIEHPQRDIDVSQYGRAAAHPALGAADYKLVAHLPGGRSVYTFCMCPGGTVVCAASEEGGVVVNGMSRFARDEVNANSALLVSVSPDDFGEGDVLAGVDLQRRVERAAFDLSRAAGGDAYQAPAQTVGDFLACSHDPSHACAPSRTVEPSYARGVVWCDLHECLPPFATRALAEALPLLDRRLRGFANPDAVMTGVETRSSSPVRIVRDERFQASFNGSAAESGVYPAGEGPGYAGGIMSAAVDGVRVAEALARHRAERNGIDIERLPVSFGRGA
ncbi:NAD(P)/FAD-dependent oxidoreductase [Gordonibacter sp. Marseille-P4307]|uniref:NAD(P)/FAD-dependent oxidoreductase n=1 Tax=Gordonibacter sp. Marseille-P4307 TaxID=2161815 RepID=UPI001F15654C|nr:FAD-dependent oxidoreductase [Gordonibacter sp. Marseille-P4307]